MLVLVHESEARAVNRECHWCMEEGRLRKLDEWMDDNGKFKGSGSNHSPNIYNCHWCEKSMHIGSWLAYVDPRTFEFISRPEEALMGKFQHVRRRDQEHPSMHLLQGQA